MIKAAKGAGADCVKFQKSTVLERFNKKCLERSEGTLYFTFKKNCFDADFNPILTERQR